MKTLSLLLLFVPTMLFAQQRLNFDAGWKFHLGNAADPALDFNYANTSAFVKSGKGDNTALAVDFDDHNWRSLSLPHDWVVELPFENSRDSNVEGHGYKPVGGHYPATSIGWYRKHFTVLSVDSGRRLVLHFDGVYRDCKVWINGFYLAGNLSGYSGFSCDITDYVRYEKENVVVVRVDASQYEGWYYEGAGIYRHVWLDSFTPVHIAENGLFFYTVSTSSASATVAIETTVINESDKTTTTKASSWLTDRDGRVIGRTAAQPLTLAPHAQTTIRQTIVVPHPRLWSPDEPYLYRAGARIEGAAAASGKTARYAGSAGYAGGDGFVGSLRDAQQLRVGIRTIRIDSSGLYVNGIYTKIKGTNNHQDHAGVGSAMPDYLHYYRARLLKEMGCNAVRTSHNPPTPEWLDACDSLGLLVLDENRLLNSSPEFSEQFHRLILRDRSRASVFLWSIGNEEGYVQTKAVGRNIAATLISRQREWDPTRTCTYAADLPNVYQGVNSVIPVRGFNYRVFAVDAYHKDHPGQPILGTEMGSTVTTRGIYAVDSVNGYLPDEDLTAPWWANTAEQWWPLCADRRWWMGGFIWTGFDYRGEPTPFQWPNINSHFGMMDVCGFPKNLYYYYKSCWTDEDVLHISPHWNWKGKEGQLIPVWVNTNAEEVELFLNGKSLGKKQMPHNLHLEWQVAYEPGTLQAVAWKKGRKITASVETTGAAEEVEVVPYKTTMLADGTEVTIVNISVVDKQGRQIPDDNRLITFHAGGDLHIIGVGNGDPSSHEADRPGLPGGGGASTAGDDHGSAAVDRGPSGDSVAQRHLFNGHCQVILQSGTHAGFYHFEAKSEGIRSGATDITLIVPGTPHSVLGWNPAGDVGHAAAGGKASAGAKGTIAPDRKSSIAAGLKGPAALYSHRPVTKMLGADISFLPELEDKGIKFSDDKGQRDAIAILKDHGFNYIRLRIFNDPSTDSGYSPGKGFCDLPHTLQMAKRVKAAGLRLLLDFHYSDYWADPGKQFKPAAWRGEDFPTLTQSLYDWTRKVMEALKAQGTSPDMVQVGNEINHGMVWPEGSIRNPDNLAALIYAGIRGVKIVDPGCPIMLHIALGGQNDESHFFLDNMLQRQVPFDVIGLSYYPRWHGSLSDLKYNVDDLARQYDKDVIVVEYTERKQEVNNIAFAIPNGHAKGTCIWEPLNTWEHIFEKDGKANSMLYLYDEMHKEFIAK